MSMDAYKPTIVPDAEVRKLTLAEIGDFAQTLEENQAGIDTTQEGMTDDEYTQLQAEVPTLEAQIQELERQEEVNSPNHREMRDMRERIALKLRDIYKNRQQWPQFANDFKFLEEQRWYGSGVAAENKAVSAIMADGSNVEGLANFFDQEIAAYREASAKWDSERATSRQSNPIPLYDELQEKKYRLDNESRRRQLHNPVMQ